MNAEQANNKTLKRSLHLFNKYIRRGKRAIKKEIRAALKCGNSHAHLFIIDGAPIINYDSMVAARQVLVKFLELNGFYVRRYTLGCRTESIDPETISFAWGSEIERFRKIDAIQEKMAKEAHNENN